jgi:hypothetical protein
MSVLGYNERSRVGACNTFPAPNRSPVVPRRGLMPKYKSTPQLAPEQISRFWSKVVVPDQQSLCWNWASTLTSTGYGRASIGTGKREYRAHRIAYELLVGPIPDGHHIDHLCRNRRCVNPAHMQPVAPRVNVLRGVGITAQNAAKTHCKRGHEFTVANTCVSNGQRICRTCKREAMRAIRTQRRQAA